MKSNSDQKNAEVGLKLQNDLLKRRPNDPERTKELERIKERLENSSPKQ
jgi:hypothetical protein